MPHVTKLIRHSTVFEHGTIKKGSLKVQFHCFFDLSHVEASAVKICPYACLEIKLV